MIPLNDLKNGQWLLFQSYGQFGGRNHINLFLGIFSLRNLREDGTETANYKMYNYIIKNHRNWPTAICLVTVTKFFLVHICNLR